MYNILLIYGLTIFISFLIGSIVDSETRDALVILTGTGVIIATLIRVGIGIATEGGIL